MVLVGVIDNTDTESGQVLKAALHFEHPQYDDKNFARTPDIALIYVDGTFKFNERVKAISLYEKNVGAASALISGWGYNKDGVADEYLRYLKTKIISMDECEQRVNEDLQSNKICIYSGRGKGTCQVRIKFL